MQDTYTFCSVASWSMWYVSNRHGEHYNCWRERMQRSEMSTKHKNNQEWEMTVTKLYENVWSNFTWTYKSMRVFFIPFEGLLANLSLQSFFYFIPNAVHLHSNVIFLCTPVLMFRSNTNSINVIILIFYSCFFLSSLVLDSERTNTTTERLSNSFSINALNEILSINFVYDYYLSLAPLLRSLNPTKVVRKKIRTWIKCEWAFLCVWPGALSASFGLFADTSNIYNECLDAMVSINTNTAYIAWITIKWHWYRRLNVCMWSAFINFGLMEKAIAFCCAFSSVYFRLFYSICWRFQSHLNGRASDHDTNFFHNIWCIFEKRFVCASIYLLWIYKTSFSPECIDFNVQKCKEHLLTTTTATIALSLFKNNQRIATFSKSIYSIKRLCSEHFNQIGWPRIIHLKNTKKCTFEFAHIIPYMCGLFRFCLNFKHWSYAPLHHFESFQRILNKQSPMHHSFAMVFLQWSKILHRLLTHCFQTLLMNVEMVDARYSSAFHSI